MVDEVQGPTIIPTQVEETNTPAPFVRVEITKVNNGFLVYARDKQYGRNEENVFLDLDGAIEQVRKSLT